MSGTYKEQKAYREELFRKPIPDGHTRCTTCLNVKLDEEYASSRVDGGKSKKCTSCREYHKRFIKAARSEWTQEELLTARKRAKHLRDTRKRQVLDAYGKVCQCCGEERIEFLQLDHIVPIGHKKRKETGEWGNRFYLSLIKRGFPPGYRCLCANCNSSLGYFGYCPHQKERSEAVAAYLEVVAPIIDAKIREDDRSFAEQLKDNRHQ